MRRGLMAMALASVASSAAVARANDLRGRRGPDHSAVG
jgi:hypothetical protein